MRSHQRAVCAIYFSVIPEQTCEKPPLIQLLQNQFNKRKKTLELLGSIILVGALCLGGTYMFLNQLAQYGW